MKDSALVWIIEGIKWFIAITTSALTAAWLSADFDIQMLIGLTTIDFVTSIINPYRQLTVTAKRIAMMLILVMTAHIAYNAAISHNKINFGPIDLSTIVCAYYIVGESVRVVVNCAIWTSIPPKLLELLLKADGITGRDQREVEAIMRRQEQKEDAKE